MLEHISTRFNAPAEPSRRERRAALILNRFTRTLAVLYATESLADLLGVTPEELDGKSFYEMIDRGCHADAIRVLESAKANDSIAYLRFWYRDPRRPHEVDSPSPSSSDSDEEGGVLLNQPMPGAYPGTNMNVDMADHESRNGTTSHGSSTLRPDMTNSRTSSDQSYRHGPASAMSVFDRTQSQQSRSSSSSAPPRNSQGRNDNSRGSDGSSRNQRGSILVEAVVSCSSDGMVVILRRVPDQQPEEQQPPQPVSHDAYGGPQKMHVHQQTTLFAAPWGLTPIIPEIKDVYKEPAYVVKQEMYPHLKALEAHAATTGGPQNPVFMQSIREVAVFAWALTGINGTIAQHAIGIPRAPAVPPQGLPVWDRSTPIDSIEPPQNQALNKWTELHARATGRNENPLPFMQQEYDPQQYHRQEQLVRQQFEHPYGPDAPGSSARRHLGKFIGEDGHGPRMLHANANPWLAANMQQQGYHQQEGGFGGQQRQMHNCLNGISSGFGQQQQQHFKPDTYQQPQQGFGAPRPPPQQHDFQHAGQENQPFKQEAFKQEQYIKQEHGHGNYGYQPSAPQVPGAYAPSSAFDASASQAGPSNLGYASGSNSDSRGYFSGIGSGSNGSGSNGSGNYNWREGSAGTGSGQSPERYLWY